VLDRTRPKAVAESRLHSSSVKVHGAPSPQWNPWQRGRREHPRAGNPRSLPIWRAEVKSNSAQDPHLGAAGKPEGRQISLEPSPERSCTGWWATILAKTRSPQPEHLAIGRRMTTWSPMARWYMGKVKGIRRSAPHAGQRIKTLAWSHFPPPDCVTRGDAGRQVR